MKYVLLGLLLPLLLGMLLPHNRINGDVTLHALEPHLRCALIP